MTPDTGQAGTGRVPRARSGGNDYAELVKKVADALMKAQVAVYPIDSAGVTKDDHLASKHTVNEMAERTGGLAFRNRNDIGAGIRKSIEDGSTHYTLSYY